MSALSSRFCDTPDGRAEADPEDDGGLLRAACERLLTNAIAALEKAPPNGLDERLRDGLRELAAAVDVDRVTWLEFAPDGALRRQVVSRLQSQGGPAPRSLAGGELPWFAAQLRQGRTLVLRRLPEDLPDEAEAERRYGLEQGLKSSLLIPLRVGDGCGAALAFDSFTRFGSWSDELILRLRLLGEVWAQTLAHRQALAVLRDSEQRFRLVADFCYDWEFWLAPDGRLLYVSPSCERITGYRSEDFLADPGLLERVIHEADRAHFVEHLRSDATTGPQALDLRIVTRHGEVRWLSHLCQSVFGPGGEVLGRRASNRDITDRKQMEQQLEDAVASWQSTFDAVRDVVTILNRDMRIVMVNASAADFFGRPADRIVGQHCHLLTHGTEHPVDGCPFARARHTRQRAEAEIYDPQRDRWLQVSIDPVLDGDDVSHFVHTARDITERKRSQLALEQAYCEIQQLKSRLEQENLYLRGQVQPTQLPGGIVGRSPTLLHVLGQVEQVAKTPATVLITGETGTGKELVAAAIHDASPRRDRVMVRVNCAALPAALIESELFGREKGAYTGAMSKQLGRFELADGSTIFLDEVGELPPELQAKLLRVLEEGTFERLGSPKTIRVDVRVIAASNRDLNQAVRHGRFREDLFYRLNVFPICLPPLRDRPEDIPALVAAFVDEFGKSLGKPVESVGASTIATMQRYPWPGNVRELRNVIERAMIVSDGTTLHIELPAAHDGTAPSGRALADVERTHILQVLEQTGWRVRGRGGAAEILGIKPTTLESRMARAGIRRPTTPHAIS